MSEGVRTLIKCLWIKPSTLQENVDIVIKIIVFKKTSLGTFKIKLCAALVSLW